MKTFLTALLAIVSSSVFAQTGFSAEDSIKIEAQKKIINEKTNCCSQSQPFTMRTVYKNGVIYWMDGYIKMKENIVNLVPADKAKSKYEEDKRFGISETIMHSNGIVIKKEGWKESPEYKIKFNRTNIEEDARTFNSFRKLEDAEVVYQALVSISRIVLANQ